MMNKRSAVFDVPDSLVFIDNCHHGSGLPALAALINILQGFSPQFTALSGHSLSSRHIKNLEKY